MDLLKIVQASDIFPPSGATEKTFSLPENSLDWCKKVSEHVSDLFKAISDIKDELRRCKETNLSSTYCSATEFTAERKQTDEVIKSLKKENAELRNEVKELKHKMIHMESQSRRENLLFDGVDEAENETWEESERKVFEILSKMEIAGHDNIKFERVHRVGEKSTTKPRTIIAKFSYFKDRENVWQHRFNLKKSKIWVSEDFPYEILKARQILYPALREGLRLKKDPKSGIKSVSLRIDKLYVNKKQFTANDTDKLPQCLQPQQIATKTDPVTNVTAFYTKHSIFSNMNTKFPFKIEGRQYNCPEQFFHYCKAIHFNDTESAQKIMSTLDPFSQLGYGKSVKNYNHASWNKKANQTLLKANRAKYEQNDEARKALFATGNATLAEASPSKEWGTGVRLHDKDSTDPTKWVGQNQMGQILMQIRDNLKLEKMC